MTPVYIDFMKSLALLAEGMVGVLAVVAVIYGLVELLMLCFNKRSKKEKAN